MRRREFTALLGGGAALWPLAGRAQPAIPLIGYLGSGSLEADAGRMVAFRRGLAEVGFTEGQNVAIEYRWAQTQYSLLPDLIADFIGRRAAVIFASGSATALAVKGATMTTPVIFVSGGDPVSMGLVASLNRPGGNLTCLSVFNGTLIAKKLELLRELIPDAAVVAMLSNQHATGVQGDEMEFQSAAQAIGQRFLNLYATTSARSMPPLRGWWTIGSAP
jgi:putative ABC transport system substrate-binding protein